MALALVAGVALRMLAAQRGHNFDVDSYRIVADIVARGGNVYAETTRYNYGPVWFQILHTLDLLPDWASDSTQSLHLKVAALLTLVDVCIFGFLLRRHSRSAAVLFFLNPISIIVTGYHSQFDNLAILIGLLAIAPYRRDALLANRLACLALLGISLSVKHVFFLLPLWLAFREPTVRRKLLVLLLPSAVFLAGLVPYLQGGAAGIYHNVFAYRSSDNAPLWVFVTPELFYWILPKFLLFIGALSLLGLYQHARGELELTYVYLVAVVAFSSAVTNQALVIPAAAIAVLWNPAFATYLVLGTMFLAFQPIELGLGATWVADATGGYNALTALLAAGLFLTLCDRAGRRALAAQTRARLAGAAQRIQAQLGAPW